MKATKQKQESDERPETGYKDVSDAQEQAAKDAEAPLELDEDGKPTNLTSEAQREVAEEMAYRAGAQANGGGPWPPEILRERFTGSTPLHRSVVGNYTSHEEQEDDKK